MLLKLDGIGIPLKLVYDFSKDSKKNSQYIADAQALTLDASRPLMGLKGTFGLFGSPDWWSSIERGKMPLRYISGIIQDAFAAGQDANNKNNSIRILLEDGSTHDAGIYVNDKADIALFRAGHRVELVYALDELKNQPSYDGGVNYSQTALEVAVSLEPVETPPR